MIAAIPTRYNETIFRSRLEARWAAFFDLVGWRWAYEPLDLAGYIPDFVLTAPNGCALLVECKPDAADFTMAQIKIQNSGWTGRSVVLLAMLSVLASGELSPGFDGYGTARRLVFTHCEHCEGLTLCNDSIGCMRCCHGLNSQMALDPGAPGVETLWRRAGNMVQWAAHGLPERMKPRA